MLRVISLPEKKEYSAYYQKYIDKVKGNPIEVLSKQVDDFTDFVHENVDRMDHRYAPGKWSIKESLIHLIDSEQIFAYRALRIGRGDTTPLAGYDQDEYIENNGFDHISPWDILEEFTHQRRATLSMIKKFKEEELTRIGVANNSPASVRAIIYIMAGHAQHHLELFQAKYV